MTRTDLASRVGVSAQAIAALENGVSKQPSFVVGILLSRVLRVWPAALAGLEPPSIVRFETDDEKFRFGVVIDYRDVRSADGSEIREWTRLLSEALGAIPGVKTQSVDTADWTVPSMITADPVAQIPPVSPELTKMIANLDRRLGTIERDIRRVLSAKESKSPRR